MKELWVDSYAPKSLADFVFSDKQQKQKIETWLKEGVLPNILLSGHAGIGKTSLATLMFGLLKVEPFDLLEINASKDNGVEFIRDTVTNFCERLGFGGFKYILLDEADGLSPAAQGTLRGTMEKYSSTTRFILTCVTGNTKIYTPIGWKYIKNVLENDIILSTNDKLTNKTILMSKSTDVYRITTLHNHVIEATGNHKFLTLNGPVDVADLAIGDRLSVSLTQTYGNDFECVDNSNFFDINDFKNFLKEIGILTNEQLIFLKDNKHLWFTKNHKTCYDYIVEHDITNTTIPLLSKKIGVTGLNVRGFLGKINKYVTKIGYTKQDNFEYGIDLTGLISDVEKFKELALKLGVDSTKVTPLNIRKAVTIEEYVKKLPKFTDDIILSIGRLIGFCEGDGHLSTTFHAAADNKNTLEKVYGDVSKFAPYLKLNISKNGQDDTKGLCSYYNDTHFKTLLRYFGATVGNKTTQIRKLSKFANNKLFFKGFMQGFYDSDGKKFDIIDDLTITPINLGQNIYNDNQQVFFDEIAYKFKEHFGMELSVRVKTDSYQSSFGGSFKRMTLYSGLQENIMKYNDIIGHYYDKIPNVYISNYIRYKLTCDGYNFLRYSEWKEKYAGFGMLNDEIKKIEKLNGAHDVYDCSFETNHWYITNGFVSHNCNYRNKIIPALHSRCQTFNVTKLDKDEFTMRLANILVNESIELDEACMEALDGIIKQTYPDLRKAIGTMQGLVRDNKLWAPITNDETTSDYKIEMIALFRARRFKEARTLVCSQIAIDEYEEVFRFCYQNLDIWADCELKEGKCIIAIRDGAVKHTLIMDPELNLSALLVELEMIANE